MEILFAAGHLPSSKARQAGAKTSYYMCEHLAHRHRLHLLAFAPACEIAEMGNADLSIFASWEVATVTRMARLLGVLTAPRLPLAIAARHSRKFQQKLRRIVEKRRPDIVIFDHTAMFQYVTSLPVPAVTMGSAHDVFTQAWRRKAMQAANPLSRLLLRMESLRIERWEKKVCARLDLVVPHSDKDKEILEVLQPRALVIAIDPWMSLPAGDAIALREPGAMIFWGAMNRAENVDAVRWAAKEILPAIRRAVPHARFYIAGAHGEQLAPEFAGRNDIVITGFVQDVGALMSRMDVALLPLRLGAGIKVKTLECMAAGLPVVTTSVGAEGVGGIHGTHYLVQDAADQIAVQTIQLLQDSANARRMGARAREFITESRDFAGRMRRVEESLIQAVAERRNRGNTARLSPSI